MTTQYTRPVASIRGESGAICGSGWLALGRYVITCAHVLDDALKRPRGTTERPEGTFKFELPFVGKTGLTGRVVAWYPVRPLADLVRDPLADIAVLELEGGKELSGGIEPVAVDRRIPPRGTGFLTYGFPVGFDNGIEASGEVLVQDPGGWLQVRDTQAFGYFIQPGFSGAPVVSKTDLRLIGMATAADRDKTTRLAFLLPAQLICRALPLLANPYRGLFAFGEEDADLFFGRENFVAELQAKLERHPFAAVIGPSGSGKSSVVLAGLAPKLLAQDWNVAVCRPLRDPLFQLSLGLASLTNPNPANFSVRNKEAEEWAARLRNDPGRIVDLAREIGGNTPGRQRRTLLIIDQFEELFTHDAEAPDGAVARKAEITGEDGSPRQAQFLAVLEAIAAQDPDSSPIRAVATMRADFMGHALAIRRLAGLLQDTDVKLGPMTAAELSEAVRRPARTFGVEFEDGLAEELVTAMQGRTGGLPLLQFALDRLWRQQEGCRLTWAAYKGPDGKGGLETALNEHAEGVVRRLGAAAEAGVRRVMLRLVRLGEDGAPDTRAVVHRREIGKADWPLAQKLADERSRLLTFGRDPATGGETAEVVHEALIGAWGRLQGWLQEDRAFGLWRQRLKESLQAASASPEDQDVLLRGRLLSEASTWLESRGDDLNDAERAFIKASQDHARQEAEEELEQARERERLANELAKAANESEKRAKELAVAAQELADTRGRALQDAERARKRQKRMNNWLRGALASLLITLMVGTYFYVRAKWQSNIASLNQASALTALSKAEIAAGRTDTALRLALASFGLLRKAGLDVPRNVIAGILEADIQNRLFLELGDPLSEIDDAAFSQDGQQVVTAGTHVKVWNAITGKLVASLGAETNFFSSATFDRSGTRILTLSSGSSARVWDARSGTALLSIGGGSRLYTAILSPDGSRILTTAEDTPPKIWDAATGRELVKLAGHTDLVDSATFSEDGSRVVTASRDGTVRVWDATTGRQLSILEGHTDIVVSAVFSPDGNRIATASWDRTARIWDAASGKSLLVLGGKGDPLRTVVFSHDGLKLLTDAGSAASFNDGNTVHIWDATNGNKLRDLALPKGSVASAAFSADDTLILTLSAKEIGSNSNNNTARLWDVKTGDELATFGEEYEDILSAAFSPDGSRVVTTSSGHKAKIWDARRNRAQLVLRGHHNTVDSAVFNSLNTRIMTTSWDSSVALWDAATGELLLQISGKKVAPFARFSPDGSRILTITQEGTSATILDAETAREILTLIGHEDIITSASFSQDGSRVVTASKDKTVRVWDATTGRQLSVLVGHSEAVLSAVFNPDGTRVATTSSDQSVRVWDSATGKEVLVLAGNEGPAAAVFFNSTGTRLIAEFGNEGVFNRGSGYNVRLWDANSGKRLLEVKGFQVGVVAVSHDGSRLIAGMDAGIAQMWDTMDGKLLSTLRGHSDYVDNIVFSHHDEFVATSANVRNGLYENTDTTVRLWQTQTGNVVRVLKGHRNVVMTIEFNKDDTEIVTASLDGTVGLWSLRTGEEIASMPTNVGYVYSASYDADSSRVVMASVDGTATVWTVSGDQVIDTACLRLAQTKLSQTELDRLGLRATDDPCTARY